MNFYEALNLEPDATIEEIEEAYRRLARKVHPDLNPQDSFTAEARMKLLNEIRDTLTHPRRRAAYDTQLQLRTHQSSPRRDRPGVSRVLKKWGTLLWPQWAIFLIAVVTGSILGILTFFFWKENLLRKASGPEQIVEPMIQKAPEAQLPGDQLPHRAPVPSERTRSHRKTPKVIQVGSTLQEVIDELGRPDRVEESSADGLRILHYGKLRLLIKDGKVAQGSGVR
jgi:curved DNA-binding protein CbpA